MNRVSYILLKTANTEFIIIGLILITIQVLDFYHISERSLRPVGVILKCRGLVALNVQLTLVCRWVSQAKGNIDFVFVIHSSL